ncbi:MAG: T9SS type A sorting domain-containing protein [Bacteroidales bacterium]|nr:T9SS type A sorting domain-containing protein [Bacteroidales bacterium]
MRRYTKFPVYFLLQFLLLQAFGQQFDRADSYAVDNSNEVAALTTDANNNAYMAGVYGASQFLPYTGDCYLLKASPAGMVIWTRYFTGLVQIGDIVVSGDQVLIVGQANGNFSYDGVACGLPAYHMFTMKVDSSGNLLWIKTDDTRNGSGSNLVAGENGKIAVNYKGISNIDNYIEIMDSEGVVLQSKQIAGHYANIVDIAYYDDRVYLNGGFNGPDSLVIDDIVIYQPDVEHAAFVLALDDDFIAEWASVDTTINNRDGRIVAGEEGVYAYFSALEPPFTIVNVLKKFSFDGQMIREEALPFFTTGITLYPDMALAPGLVGLYVNNDFGFNNHEVILYDADLNLLGEMSVQGLSDLYSGQITGCDVGFLISHVHSGDLNFNNEITLSYAGPEKRPYLSRVSFAEPTGIAGAGPGNHRLLCYPDPADDLVNLVLPDSGTGLADVMILDISGKTVFHAGLPLGHSSINVSHLPAGIYPVVVKSADNKVFRKKLVIR